MADVGEVLPTDKWGTKAKILRIICHILRFTHILKGGGEYDTRDTPLHRDIIVPVELQEAEFRLFLYLKNGAIVMSWLVCDKNGVYPVNQAL